MEPSPKIVMIQVQNLSFRYPGADKKSLRDVSFDICRGERVLITGPTGCGKSTLLKAMSGIIPHASSGRMNGRVMVAGRDVESRTLAGLSKDLGLVFQSPDDQILCDRVIILDTGALIMDFTPDLISEHQDAVDGAQYAKSI